MKSKLLFTTFLAFFLLTCVVVGHAQIVSVPTHGDAAIDSDIVDVMPGDTVMERSFTVHTTDEHYTFDGVALVNGVAISVISPKGAVFVPNGDSRIQFFPNTIITPLTPLIGEIKGHNIPGGTFGIDEITPNEVGVWKLRFTFPPAPQKTRIGASIMLDSAYRIGLWTDMPSGKTRDVSLITAGNTSRIWVFGTKSRDAVNLHVLPPGDAMSVETGQIVVNSNPKVTVTKVPSGSPVEKVSMKDDGREPDGKAGDGLFAGTYKFDKPGSYWLEAYVTMQTPNGPVTRYIQQWVTVNEPPRKPNDSHAH